MPYPYYQNPYMTVYPQASYSYINNPYIPQYQNNVYQPSQTTPQQMYNTQMPQQAPQVQQQSDMFNWVKNEKEVESEYVAPNGVKTFWHETDPVVYMKQADATGKPTIRTFDLVERVQKPVSEEKAPDYATKEELAIFGNNLSSFSSVVKEMNDAVSSLKADLETMKNDMYGLAGKKKIIRKTEADVDE